MTDKIATVSKVTALTNVEDLPEDLVKDQGRGTENIATEDLRPPQLVLCQAGTPQRKPDDPKQIQGLQELDMFNDLSQEIYGRGPLQFAVISYLGHRNMIFPPKEEGGFPIEVPDSDPRTQFTPNPDNPRKNFKPIATRFENYLIWLSEKQEVVVFSLKSTGLKTSVQLRRILMSPLKIQGRVLPYAPAWARTFTLKTRMDKDGDYSWGSFQIENAGITPVETRQICSMLADTYGKKTIIIEHDNNDIDTEAVRDDAFDKVSLP